MHLTDAQIIAGLKACKKLDVHSLTDSQIAMVFRHAVEKDASAIRPEAHLTAIGKELDEIGRAYGVERPLGETDESFRNQLRAVLAATADAPAAEPVALTDVTKQLAEALEAGHCGYARIKEGEYKLAGMRSNAVMADGELHPLFTFTEAHVENIALLLSTRPPAPEEGKDAARTPLTMEQIHAIDDEVMKAPRGYCVKFARAIEAAHGITDVCNKLKAESEAQAFIDIEPDAPNVEVAK